MAKAALYVCQPYPREKGRLKATSPVTLADEAKARLRGDKLLASARIAVAFGSAP